MNSAYPYFYPANVSAGVDQPPADQTNLDEVIIVLTQSTYTVGAVSSIQTLVAEDLPWEPTSAYATGCGQYVGFTINQDKMLLASQGVGCSM